MHHTYICPPVYLLPSLSIRGFNTPLAPPPLFWVLMGQNKGDDGWGYHGTGFSSLVKEYLYMLSFNFWCLHTFELKSRGAGKRRNKRRKKRLGACTCTYIDRYMYRVPELYDKLLDTMQVESAASAFDLPGISIRPIAITWGARGSPFFFGLLCIDSLAICTDIAYISSHIT